VQVAGNLTVVADGPTTDDGFHTGKITITGQQVPLGGELPIIEVKLDGATLEEYKNIMCLGLLADRDASFRGEYHIPKRLTGDVTTRIRLWLLGRRDGTLPDLELTVMVIDQPVDPLIGTALPPPDANVAIDTGFDILKDKYIEVESDDIVAKPGSAIQFTISRKAAAGDGYDDDVLVIKRLAVIT
jgi:hypothetical protein